MPTVVITLWDYRENVWINLQENAASPYGALCNALGGARGAPFRLMWRTDRGQLLPITSDRSLVEAFHLRCDPRLPLWIIAFESRKIRGFHGNAGPPIGPDVVLSHRPVGLEQSSGRDAGRVNRGKLTGPKMMDELRKITAASAWRPVPMARNQKEHHLETTGIGGFEAMMPKDPSLAELVDSVRRSLDVALSNLCVRTQSATSPQVPMDTAPVAAKREESTAALLPERAVPQLEENIMTQTAEETEEVLEELCRTRCASAASEDFMVPSFPQHTFVDVDPECCPEYPDREVDALLSDLESEDAFEIVEAPDEWDSDVEWHTEWNAMEAATTSAHCT